MYALLPVGIININNCEKVATFGVHLIDKIKPRKCDPIITTFTV